MTLKRVALSIAAFAVVAHPTLGCSSSNDAVAPPPDASPDAAAPRDASSDASHDAMINGCVPADVTTFTPPTYVNATGGHQGKCTLAQIRSFYDDCLAPGSTQASCAPFNAASGTAANKACAVCIVSPDTATAYGAIVEHKGVLSINVPGCMEIEAPVSGLMCAKSYQAADACERAACTANCPITDDASFQLYLACVHEAARDGCASYSSNLSCTNDLADGGASVCFQGASFEDLYLSIAPVFCGSAPDGGANDAGGG